MSWGLKKIKKKRQSCFLAVGPGPPAKIPGYLITSMGPIAQSVLRPTADPGVASLIPARSYTMEIDHEMISIFIHLLLIQEELLSIKKITSKSMCTKYWLTA